MNSLKIKTGSIMLSAFFICSNAMAQQVFKISQFMEHNFIHNPAASGATDVTTAGAVFRSQWSGISGSPTTTLVFADKYFEAQKAGVGVVLYTDKTGATSRSGGDINFSYSVQLDDKGKKLMLGIGAQVLQFKVDKDKIAEFIPNDPLLASSGNAIKGDANAGAYLRTPDFNIGVSVRNLIQPHLNFVKSSSTSEVGMLYRHFFLNANGRIKTDEDNVLIPHVELRYQPNAPVDFEGGVVLDHKDFLRIGFSAHYRQDYTIVAGIKIDHKFFIGYAYDAYKNPLSVFDGGNAAHELSLRYFFTK
jgi:type IX secretion system PorP/SprF family membrane protein